MSELILTTANLNDLAERLGDKITESKNERWLTSKQAAKYLKVSKSHLLRNLRDQIGCSELGRVIVFDKHDLDKFWEQRKKQ